MRIHLAATLLAGSALLAQDGSYWVANRASNDIMRIAPWGAVLQRVDMGTSLRSAHVAPDGKVWVVRFIQSTFDIYDPATGVITPVSAALGSPYDIAFDRNGDAWVSGGSGVEEFDANGNSLGTYVLSAASPLGITIDTDDNKWIAHRTTTGSVSRIDAAGAIQNFPVSGSQPVRPIADFRGLLTSSHIWVTCDSGGALIELDATGAELNNYTLPNTSIGGSGPVFDNNGDIWVGSFANGDLFHIDETNGTILNTYSISPSINGLTVDTQGRILVSQRVTFSPPGPPCQFSRIDPATGQVEVIGALELGGASAYGTQSAPSTPYQYSLVVDQIGDTDGDGDPNFTEIQNGTSPIDARSNSEFSVHTSGTTNLGGAATVEVTTASAWVVGFSAGLTPPTTVPGFSGLLEIDPTTLQGTVGGIGSASPVVPIPNQPSLAGLNLFMQGVVLNTSNALEFRNLTGIHVW